MRTDVSAVLGTSHHGLTIVASTNEIKNKLGLDPNYYKPENYEDKSTREWDVITDYNLRFTIYDWKEDRYFDDDEAIVWHIGTRSNEDQEKVRELLNTLGLK